MRSGGERGENVTWTFVRGTADQPKGHALLFFQGEPSGQVLATYLVVLPIRLDLSKYIPPLLAGRLPTVASLSVVPFPPVPEPVESRSWLERLAARRADDLLDGGTVSETPETLMLRVAEIAQEYARLYDEHLQRQPAEPESEPAVPVPAVLYRLLSEQERLAELAKLVGKLRYALDCGDRALEQEALLEMHHLVQALPAKYRPEEILTAVRQPGPQGQRLAELYIDRCYRLYHEDYQAVQAIDREIARLRGERPPDG